MERYHVIDTWIDRPHVKKKIFLPVWIRHITGVLFFPVIKPTPIPDSEPLGVVGLSLNNEQLNVVTNFKVYKKTPIYYKAPDYQNAEGQIFLDRGYGAYDFLACNDMVSPNSYAIFKYANRKTVKTINDVERFNMDFANLNTLISKRVIYQGKQGIVLSITTSGDIIIITLLKIGSGLLPVSGIQRIEINRKDLAQTIGQFINPLTDEPYFEDDSGYDESFTMKTILRYEATQ